MLRTLATQCDVELREGMAKQSLVVILQGLGMHMLEDSVGCRGDFSAPRGDMELILF